MRPSDKRGIGLPVLEELGLSYADRLGLVCPMADGGRPQPWYKTVGFIGPREPKISEKNKWT